jgi:type II secretory pathway pseudopilin PulG
MAATNTYPAGHRRQKRSGGFTLVEILVVLCIILVLVGILMPAIAKGYRNGVRTRMAADLASIATALEAYKQDHGDFPRVSPATPTAAPLALERGDALLCRALMGPQSLAADGQDGLGFRVRPAIGGVPQGKVYGPYIGADKFKYDTTNFVLFDKSGVRILYFPANKAANTTVPGGFVAATFYAGGGVRPAFNANDNDVKLFDYGAGNAANGLKKFQLLMGADINTGAALDPQISGEFLLWSAGPDEKFGIEAAVDQTIAEKQRALCDDVSYPGR